MPLDRQEIALTLERKALEPGKMFYNKIEPRCQSGRDSGAIPTGEIAPAVTAAILSSCRVSRKIQPGMVFQRWITALCLGLVLMLTAVEAVHTHPSGAFSGSSGSPCLVCMSVHATAPALIAHFSPALLEVGIVAIAAEFEAQGITTLLELFTRPPPLSA